MSDEVLTTRRAREARYRGDPAGDFEVGDAEGQVAFAAPRDSSRPLLAGTSREVVVSFVDSQTTRFHERAPILLPATTRPAAPYRAPDRPSRPRATS